MFKFFCFSFLYISCFSQNEFEIIQSNTLENQTKNNEKYEVFSGNVIAKHKQHILYCDTMLISKKNKFVKAWGSENNKILIKDTNDLKIESNKIFFFKNDSIINFKINVSCIKGKQEIYTDDLIYNSKEKIVYYENGGRIHDEDIKIYSEQCKYKLETENAHFYQNVHLIGEDYSVLSDEITFNKKKELIVFNERSEIIKDSLNIKGDYGFYQKKREYLELSENIVVNKSDKVEIKSNKLINKNNISEFTEKPNIILKSEKSDFIIKGDKIIINNQDSILSVFDNVYMYNDSISGKCDKSVYNLVSDKISLIHQPVLWVNKQQITGDTIFLYTKNESLDSIYIPKNSFISSKKKGRYYNQIKGKKLHGKFIKNKILYIDVNGNSTLKYFNEKNGKIDGINDITSNKMKIHFKQSDIDKIYFNGEPDANYTPIQLVKESDIYLNGFFLIDVTDN